MEKPLYLQKEYINAKIKQTMSWRNGVPYQDKVYNECCFDFSCCNPELFEKDYAKRLSESNKFLIDLITRYSDAQLIELGQHG